MPRPPRPAPIRRGAAAVELALVLPLLMTFLFGIWEVGRFLDAMQTLQAAAREGARQAAAGACVDPASGQSTRVYATPQGADPGPGVAPPDWETAVKTSLAREGCATANVTVAFANLSPSTPPSPYGDKNDPYKANRLDRLEVQVTIPYSDIRWSPTDMVLKTGSTLTVRLEFVSLLDEPFAVNSTIPNN